MRANRSIYIGAGIAVLVLALGCAGFFIWKIAASNAADNVFADAGNASSSAPIASGTIIPPPNSKLYQSAAYSFSLYYPDDLTLSDQTIGASSTVLLFEDAATEEGFDIFVTPYSEPKITQARFEMDEPSGVMNDPQNITIDGTPATEFLSTNPAMGASREIWFLHGGYLYEVTAPQSLDSWLLSIMETWQFTS